LEEGPNAFNGFIEKTITLPQKGSSILPFRGKENLHFETKTQGV